MVEKFSDYEGAAYLKEEGVFEFEIVSGELKLSKNGTNMVVLDVRSDAGQSTIYHSLNPKARWSYNNLIKACLRLDTREKINSFECDYEIVHQQLIGKKFKGVVTCEKYDKEVKVPLDDGTFETTTETRDSYKITEYLMA